MSVTAVIGAQWGDEGKGKIVDLLSQSAHMVVRFNGGNNAGHTVINEYGESALHLIPAGIFHEGTLCIIERGVVVHPPSLVDEIKVLLEKKVALNGLMISRSAHMVVSWHIAEDQRHESGVAIGTTLRGIGPCYQDKVGRWHAIRIGDLINKDFFITRLEELYTFKVKELRAKFSQNGEEILPPLETIRKEYLEAREYILPYIGDTSRAIRRARAGNENIFLEGAQGTLLDVDHGTYPYVTSSNTVSAAAALLTGIPAREITSVIGVAKAYLTRVGEGPFPTEIRTKEGEKLREAGREYGATTGRPRRCGWPDLPLLRYACMVNDFTEIALTKLDILGLLDQIKVCIGYRGMEEDPDLTDLWDLDIQRPKYTNYHGWGDLSGCRFRDELPEEAARYVNAIEQYIGVRVRYISIGGKRKEIITL